MNVPLITWSVISGLFIFAVVIWAVRLILMPSKNKKSIISESSEREIFYIPGDPLHPYEHAYDDVEDI